MSLSQVYSNIRFFFSSASSDKSLFNKLKKHLSGLKWQDLLAKKDDSTTDVRSDLGQFIESNIDNANIIVWLISAEFLASKQEEIQRARELQKAGFAYIIPILLRPVALNGLSLDQYSCLPSDGKPVSLWPDKDEALTDVAHGIWRAVKDLHDRSVNARSPAETEIPLDEIPYNPLFTDRKSVLTTLRDHFTSGQALQQPQILALNGLPGIGKTQIAAKYAYDYRGEYKNILWLKAASQQVLSNEIHTRASLFSLSDQDQEDDQRRFAAVKRWLHDHKEWLLVLDNFDNSDDSNLLIHQLIPYPCNGHVLLTTLDQASGTRIRAVPVKEMAPEYGVLFLLRRAGIIDAQAPLEKASEADRKEAELIVQEVDGLPLALDQAGAYINKTGCGLTRYHALYLQHSMELLKQRGKYNDDHSESAAVTFSIAFKKIANTYPDALALLSLFAFLPPGTIPREMIEQGVPILDGPLHALAVDPLKLEDAIAILRGFSLVHCHADALSIHRVVRTILVAEMSAKQQRLWAVRVVRMVSAIFPAPQPDNWSLCERYLSQAQECAELIHQFQPARREVVYLQDAVDLLEHLGSYYCQRSCYQDAEKYLTQALELCEQKIGLEPLDKARVFNSLAILRHKQGKYQEAEKLYLLARTIWEQEPNADLSDTAMVLNNLAALYSTLRKYQEAEDLYRKVRLIDEITVGPNHPDAVATLNNLAFLYYEQGKYQEAEPLLQNVLFIEENEFSNNHSDLANSLNNLASLYEKQGRYERAEEYYRRAFTLREHNLGPEHSETAQSLNNLAGIYVKLGKYQEAEPLYLRALTIWEQRLEPDHPDIARVLNNLAQLSRQQRQYQESEQYYRQSLAICEQALGFEHPETALVLGGLGKLYLMQKKDGLAEQFLRRALSIREKVLGSEHPDTAESLSDLAELLTHQKQYNQADALFQRALNIYQQASNLEHPDVVHVMERYARLLEYTARTEEAKEIERAICRIKDKHTNMLYIPKASE